MAGRSRRPLLEGTHGNPSREASSLPSNNKGRRTRASSTPGPGTALVPAPDRLRFHGDPPSSRAGMTKELSPQRKDFSGRAASLPRRWRKGVSAAGRGRGKEEQETGTARTPSSLTGGSLLSLPLSLQRLPLYLPAPKRLTGRFEYPRSIHFLTCFVSRYRDTELRLPARTPRLVLRMCRSRGSSSGGGGGSKSNSGKRRRSQGHGTQIRAASPDGERNVATSVGRVKGVTRTRSSIGAAVRVMGTSRAVVMG